MNRARNNRKKAKIPIVTDPRKVKAASIILDEYYVECPQCSELQVVKPDLEFLPFKIMVPNHKKWCPMKQYSS